MTPTLHVDIKFDLICPWCWIGKQNLDVALNLVRREVPELVVEKSWYGVQLLPDTPEAGLPFARFYQDRLGGEFAMRRRQMQVGSAAADAGLRIHFERIETFPNTAKAHRLLEFVRASDDSARYEAMLQRLFEAYFVDGKNIGDTGVLLDIAKTLAWSVASVAAALETPAAVDGEWLTFFSVPHFLFNGKHSMFGAQQPDILARAILSFIHEDTSSDTPLPAAE